MWNDMKGSSTHMYLRIEFDSAKNSIVSKSRFRLLGLGHLFCGRSRVYLNGPTNFQILWTKTISPVTTQFHACKLCIAYSLYPTNMNHLSFTFAFSTTRNYLILLSWTTAFSWFQIVKYFNF